jgi:hypothetical protein
MLGSITSSGDSAAECRPPTMQGSCVLLRENGGVVISMQWENLQATRKSSLQAASFRPQQRPRITLPPLRRRQRAIRLALSALLSRAWGTRAARKQTRALPDPQTPLGRQLHVLREGREGGEEGQVKGVRASAEQHDWSWTWVSGLVPDRRQKKVELRPKPPSYDDRRLPKSRCQHQDLHDQNKNRRQARE